ncbi:MAG: glycosyltransferase family 4 protein [Cytophagales bacterium]|nr:glycosyltransferase family 4 protein [Cytophaga sp.]
MKIAIVANTSWNIFNFRMNLIRGFKEQGIEVICIAPEDRFSARIKEEGVDFYPVVIHAKGNNPMKDIYLIRQFYKIYNTTRPDIILQYTIKPNIYGTVAASLSNIPVINTVTGLGTVFLHNNWVSGIAKVLYKCSFRFADKVLFQNKDDQQFFIQKGLVSAFKTAVVPGSGVNTDVFYPSLKQQDSFTFRFVMAARLLYDKGIREYAEASLWLHKYYGERVECHLIGALDTDKQLGIQEDVLHEWLTKHHIHYHAFSENIIGWYKKADAVVLPSYREGVPKTLLEAAACAKPLIATDVAGCREIVRNEWNGFLCKSADAADLTAKMERMMNTSNAEREQMGQNSYLLVQQNFSDKILFNEYFCQIKELLKQ